MRSSRGSTSPVWHPFTQHAVHGEIPTIVKNEGAWLEVADGRKIFDAISSWWVVTHGHRYPPIMAAIRAQTELADQIIFAGFSHPPAEDLAQRLVAITPSGLDHVFYSDSGSTAVEVGLKMALGFWLHSGEPRRHILALEGAYHGDTIGGMSVASGASSTRPTSRCCSMSAGCRFRTRAVSRTRCKRSTGPAAPRPWPP
jgi:adenosylmethionine---8-amino-7-oxononanoate aminotransferase